MDHIKTNKKRGIKLNEHNYKSKRTRWIIN